MSMQEYEIRGYGIQMPRNFKKNTTEDKVRALLEKTPDLKKEIMECFEEWEVEYEYASLLDFDEYVEIGLEVIGPSFAYLMAKALNEIYDDDFMEAITDYDGNTFLFFSRVMPWQMTEFEKGLTEERFKEILNEVYCILYEETAEVDDVSVRLFG